jgi:hypothetical protein
MPITLMLVRIMVRHQKTQSATSKSETPYNENGDQRRTLTAAFVTLSQRLIFADWLTVPVARFPEISLRIFLVQPSFYTQPLHPETVAPGRSLMAI